ncbi:DUF3099 domain-containing protein [Aestuariimicrobium soli]|uniref:DUF3099 domain-containing protein n=1 Tax=Aestuariimicrobium soli TaxID=2035834 RepID=UPI003EBF3C42
MSSQASHEHRAGRRDQPATSVTDAQPGRSEDRHRRQRNYLISMGIRVACFFGLIVTPGPWRWAFAAGAIVIPAFAVMLANVSSKPYTAPTAPDESDDPAPVPQITSGEVIQGQVVPGDDD